MANLNDELTKYLSEFDAKHQDSFWCEQFFNFIVDNGESLDSITDSSIISRVEDVFPTVITNVSDDLKIANGLFSDITITKEVLTKHRDAFVKHYNEFGIFGENAKNTLILEFCLENGIYKRLPDFDISIFSLDILNKYKEIFIAVINSNFIEPPYRTGSGDVKITFEYRHFNIFQNNNFFIFSLENGLNFAAGVFITRDKSIVTTDILNKYPEQLIAAVRGTTWAELYHDRKDVFEFCLAHNIGNILGFDISFYNMEIYDKYPEQFIKAFRSEGIVFFKEKFKNKDTLEFCLKHNLKCFVSMLNNPELCNKEMLDKYKEQVIAYLLLDSDQSLQNAISKNPAIMEFCKENGLEELVKLFAIYFLVPLEGENLEVYKRFVEIHKETLKKYIAVNGTYKNIKKSIEVLKLFIKEDILNVGMDKELAIYKIEYLYNINDEILDCLDLNILKYDFELSFLARITLYRDIQEKICQLNEKNLKLFYRIAKLINNDTIDLSSVITNFLSYVDIYSHILGDIDSSSITDEQLNNFLEILIVKCDYGITDISGLENSQFSKNKQAYFDNFDKTIDDHNLEDIREAIFQKQYGISLGSATFILNRYEYNRDDIEKSELDKEIMKIIFGIKTVIECEDKEKLIEIYRNSDQIKIDYHNFAGLEATIRKKYAELYNKALFKVNEKSKKINHPLLQNITYNGKKIDFYDTDDDFSMQIHALGAYRTFERPDNFKDNWNRPKIAYHGICTSFITNDEIATARVKHPLLGFSEYEESALLLAGNYDLFSDNAIGSFDTSSRKPYKILPPTVMKDATRHNHNEMVIERCKDLGHGRKAYKRQPSYIVYVVDSVENEENFSESNTLFQETIQAAADFDVPVVIVDRSKHSKIEMARCNELEEQFKKSHDLDVLDRLYLKYFNNNVGSRFFTTNPKFAKNNLFESSTVIEFNNRITNFILEEITDVNEQITLLSKLIDIYNREISNYAVSHKAAEQVPPFEFSTSIAFINQKIEEIKAQYASGDQVEIEQSGSKKS